MNKVLARSFPLLSLASAIAATSAWAQPADVEEVVVFGRNTNLVGQAASATEGSVSGADLLIRPMFKTAELLESMPGMVAVQHSGSGKANQYFLRGFNLDHGTDYTAQVDGIPLNLRAHGHGQGYLDVNGLLPETVERIDYRKGPYRADLGDFGTVGASFIKTIDRLERPFVSTETGRFGWRRVAGGMSQDVAGGTLTVMGETKAYDGAWQNPEELEHFALWSKYLTDMDFGQLSLTLSAYDSKWNPTEQVPERAIGTAACPDAFCSLDPTADGETTRVILGSRIESDLWTATLYAQFYDWAMKSNPTYDFQLNQFDKRWISGGSFNRLLFDGNGIELRAGADFRYDDASRVGLDNYDRGSFIANISDNEITEASLGTFVEATWRATERLRVMGGVRGDYFDFDVKALNPTSFAGTETDQRVSPKAGLAYEVNNGLEFYANWGKGFHSNDARGVVNSIDPVAGLAPQTGYETGARIAVGDFKFTTAYWWLDQESELIFVGDSNAVEPKGASEREGVEFTMFWQPLTWLGIDAVYTSSDATWVDNPDGSFVENALEEAAQLGISATKENWDASLRVRYLGPYALVADNSERAESLTTVNLRGAYHWDTLTVYAEFINLLDTDGKEITYSYEAYVPGLDPAGTSSADIDCSVTNC
ncbi:MAG: TonB-dependent receptor, partial [Pseudomonadota bacterium]|nr:TonB-dependent receptor [Pseudomonadota bacterium]